MPKESFKASRIVIRDLPKDQRISAAELKRIKGGMSFRPQLLAREWLMVSQRSTSFGYKDPSYVSSKFSSQTTQPS